MSTIIYWWTWWLARRLEIQAYLAWHTDDSYLARDLEHQAMRKRDELDRFVLHRQLGISQ
jgi:hypothetical protein